MFSLLMFTILIRQQLRFYYASVRFGYANARYYVDMGITFAIVCTMRTSLGCSIGSNNVFRQGRRMAAREKLQERVSEYKF